jgi:hypothetical protein
MMNEKLSEDWTAIDQLLAQTLDEASLVLKSLDTRPAGVSVSEQWKSTHPMLSLPNAGNGASSMLKELMERYADGFSASAGTRYWAFVTGGSTPAALMGDWIASTVDLVVGG